MRGDELRERWQAAGRRDAGTWEQVFGAAPATDELFMAWSYARYVEWVAAAGKAEYGLPLFANAWLNAEVPLPGLPAGGPQPGHYPSGGPLPHVLDIWQAAAPSLDLLAPESRAEFVARVSDAMEHPEEQRYVRLTLAARRATIGA